MVLTQEETIMAEQIMRTPDEEYDNSDIVDQIKPDPAYIYKGQTSPGTGQSWLLSYVKERRNTQRPINIVFTGETGSGKSYAAIALADMVDPNFSEENVVFTVEEYLSLLNRKPRLPQGSVIVFEEAGLGLNNHQWRELQVVIFGKTQQSARYRNIIVFYTVPRLPFIDATTRQLVQLLLEATTTRGVMKPFLIRPSSDRNDNRPWYVYPKMQVTDKDERTVTYEYREIHFPMPRKALSVPYEIKKDAHLTEVFEKMEEAVRQQRLDKEGVKQSEVGIELTCQNCNYPFHYKKASWKVKCERCGQSVDIPKHLRQFTGVEHPPLDYAALQKKADEEARALAEAGGGTEEDEENDTDKE